MNFDDMIAGLRLVAFSAFDCKILNNSEYLFNYPQ